MPRTELPRTNLDVPKLKPQALNVAVYSSHIRGCLSCCTVRSSEQVMQDLLHPRQPPLTLKDSERVRARHHARGGCRPKRQGAAAVLALEAVSCAARTALWTRLRLLRLAALCEGCGVQFEAPHGAGWFLCPAPRERETAGAVDGAMEISKLSPLSPHSPISEASKRNEAPASCAASPN